MPQPATSVPPRSRIHPPLELPSAYDQLHVVPPAAYARAMGAEATLFAAQHVDLASSDVVLASAPSHGDLGIPEGLRPTGYVTGSRLNNVRWVNKFLISLNEALPDGARVVLPLETIAQRRARLEARYPVLVAAVLRALSFAFHRVLPKLPVTKRIYFAVTAGRNRMMSEAEVLGRLYCCGFEVVETREVSGSLYVVARRIGVPQRSTNPSYGPIFAMRRVGKGGRPIHVYKLRTMHPYSEYLQRYVYERNGLEGCKVRDDFRVTRWGRVFRRFWIDELPMLINLLKGDLKLVGGRPLSEHHESLYPHDLRERRRRQRPGLIPPFYADLPKSFDEVIASEARYLDAYERHPIRTDLRYFALAVYNIVVRRARSQ